MLEEKLLLLVLCHRPLLKLFDPEFPDLFVCTFSPNKVNTLNGMHTIYILCPTQSKCFSF